MQFKSPFLNEVHRVLRVRGYAYQTEKSYIYWIRYYIKFRQDQHPNTLAEPEVERFLSYLAVNRNVAVNTQNQAFIALIFLYRHVLNKPLVVLIVVVRWKSHALRMSHSLMVLRDRVIPRRDKRFSSR